MVREYARIDKPKGTSQHRIKNESTSKGDPYRGAYKGAMSIHSRIAGIPMNRPSPAALQTGSALRFVQNTSATNMRGIDIIENMYMNTRYHGAALKARVYIT